MSPVKPGIVLQLAVTDRPVREVWQTAAERAAGGASWFGPVVYLGPAESAARLRTIAALRYRDAAGLSEPLRTALNSKAPLVWNDLAEPRALVSQLAAQAGLRVANVEAIPHDLWYRAEIPALTLIDRLTIILAQFDATFEVDAAAGTLKITTAPQSPTLEETHVVPPADAARLAALWQTRAPSAVIRAEPGKVVVVGRLEDHEQLATARSEAVAGAANPPRPGAPGTAAPAAGANIVYTLRIENRSLAQLVGYLRSKNLAIEVDETALAKAGLPLDRLTSIDVKNVTLVELLEEACRPLGLTARAKGAAVEIVPR